MAAGIVVGNDRSLSHVAGAVSTKVIPFGAATRITRTDAAERNVLRAGLPCEPGWFQGRFRACGKAIECLSTLRIETVFREVSACLS
jgi:ADP-heptose:LPS heptosyltransferase